MIDDIWKTLRHLDDDKEKNLEKQFMESINVSGFTCLDLGSNYGWWSWLFLRNIGKEGKVYAWEPNEFLYKNYLEKFPFDNLTGYCYALSDKNDEQNFYIHGTKGRESGFNSLEYNGKLPVTIKKIKTKTLDDWWSENNKPSIDFIKIDCEDHDYKILQGGKQLIDKARPKYIVIEQKNKDVTEFLKNFNYTDQHAHSESLQASSVWKYKSQYNKKKNYA